MGLNPGRGIGVREKSDRAIWRQLGYKYARFRNGEAKKTKQSLQNLDGRFCLEIISRIYLISTQEMFDRAVVALKN